jgi:phenylalanyl-tRNA synthetase beta chain
MKFSYDFLQSFFEKKLPPTEELADLLMMHFFEVESVEKNGDDFVIDIDILPSRTADCFSHIGIVREISAITGMKYKEPTVKIKQGKEDISEKIRADVKGACNRYMLRAVKGVKIKKSPEYIKKRLISCGLKPINNIVDITNYVMLETGQPLHAFDVNKIQGEKIIVRYARKRERIVTLDEKKVDLEEDVLVIADESSPLGVAGIKGGVVPEIDKNTTEIYIESANFDSKTIRKGSQKIGIRTDASVRFEHGVPCELAEIAMNRVLSLVLENAGGEVMKGVVDYYPEKSKTEEKQVKVSIDKINSVLGVEIPLKRVEEVLRSLGFKIKREGKIFTATVPYFRPDVSIPEDLIEEVGRIYGYENIEPVPPKEVVIPQKESRTLKVKKITRNILSGLGFFETYNYSFINQKKADFFNYENLTEMEKPVSLEFKYLRPSLVPNLLSNLVENEKNMPDVKMFEVGKIFTNIKKKRGEKNSLGLVCSDGDFYKTKGEVDVLFKKISGKNVFYEKKEDESGFFKKGQLAKVLIEKEEVGFLGVTSEKVKKEWKIKSNAVFGEFDFQKIINFYQEDKKYEQISKFPCSLFDVAVFVQEKTPYDDVLNKVKKTGGRYIKEVELFDVYQGEGVPENMKSFALRIHFQDKNKTLSSSKVNELQEKVMDALDSVSGWKVRKK